jgi:NADPH-dependent ferric siderophore reductase
MSSAKGKIARLLGGMLLQSAKVASAEDTGGFRRIVLKTNLPKPRAGTKVQVLLPSDDMRTYSPIASPEGFVLLGWKHAGGPGSRWLSEVQAGAELRFFAPQGSLELSEGPVVVVGDETSVAVAASFEVERQGQVQVVLQAGSVDDVRRAAEAVGLSRVSAIQRGETERLVEAALAAHKAAPEAVFALSGGSELVATIRNALRARGVRNIKTKTYWVPGKTGLD